MQSERQERILEILEERKFVTAQRLSEELFVSLPTVRRDLSELARQGLIVRNRGGARRLTDGHEHIPFAFRVGFKTQEKKQLSQAAAALVRDGDTIFLDESTTFFPIVDFLCEYKQITVVTNSIPLSVLLKKAQIRAYCLGGDLEAEDNAFYGSYTQLMAEYFNFDLMLFSSTGVNAAGEIVDHSLDATMLRRVIIRRSKRCVFVCDGEKFFEESRFSCAPITEMDAVITNREPPTAWHLSPEKLIQVR